MDSARNHLMLLLLNELLLCGGQDKHQLWRALHEKHEMDVTTSEINSVLYSNRVIFKHDDSPRPRWWSLIKVGQHQPIASSASSTGVSELYCGPELRAWQIEAYEAWCEAGRRGVIEAVTGVGKTTVAAVAAAAAAEDSLATLILVPSLDLMDQWFKSLTRDLPGLNIGQRKAGRPETLSECDIVISTVQSACRKSNLMTSQCGLLVADEVHRYGAERFARSLDTKFEQRMGLTATYERQDAGLELYLDPYFMPVERNGKSQSVIVAGCSYARGLADGILAPFRVCFIAVELTPDEHEAYTELDERARSLRKKLITKHDCPAEPFGEYMRSVSSLSKGDNGNPQSTRLARYYLSAFTKRKALLAESREKLNALDKLVETFLKAEGVLVFTETKESANSVVTLLGRIGLPARAFTSDLRKQERRSIMDSFVYGDIPVLAGPRLLDEGIDLPEVDVGVVVAASRSRLQMIQRMGRIIRPKIGGRVATFFVLYVKDTSEDPEKGAHEMFIGEMMDNAKEVKFFGADVTVDELIDWYFPC